MNVDSTFGTAILRGLYNFFCTACVAGITAYLGVAALIQGSLENAGVSSTDRLVFAILTGLLSGFGALGFRGGIEGLYDANRQENNEVKTSDVQVG